MTRHPTARRVHRPDSGADDAFVANVLESSVWARNHARTLIIAVVVIAVVVIGLLVFRSQRSAGYERATEELTPLRALAQGGQMEQAIPQFEAYLQKNGGTKPAQEARMLLAGQYLSAGQHQKAIDTVEPIGADFDSPMAVNAAFVRAAAHEALGQEAEAEKIYLSVGEKAPLQFQKNDGLDNAARLRLARGDAAGAVQLYERLIAATKESDPIRPIWQLRLGEAQAAAAASQGAAAK